MPRSRHSPRLIRLPAIPSYRPLRSGRVRRLQQGQRLDLKPRRNPLDIPQREVALAALEAADVGPVEADHVGRLFLAFISRLTTPHERRGVLAQDALQVALHEGTDAPASLPASLQTY